MTRTTRGLLLCTLLAVGGLALAQEARAQVTVNNKDCGVVRTLASMRYTPCVARAILSFGADARRPDAALLAAKIQGCGSKFEAKINRIDQTQDCSAVISAADLRAALDGQIVGLAAVLAPPNTFSEILGILGYD